MLVERIPASASRMRAAVFWVEAPITSTPECLERLAKRTQGPGLAGAGATEDADCPGSV